MLSYGKLCQVMVSFGKLWPVMVSYCKRAWTIGDRLGSRPIAMWPFWYGKYDVSTPVDFGCTLSSAPHLSQWPRGIDYWKTLKVGGLNQPKWGQSYEQLGTKITGWWLQRGLPKHRNMPNFSARKFAASPPPRFTNTDPITHIPEAPVSPCFGLLHIPHIPWTSAESDIWKIPKLWWGGFPTF